jgi:hypothetical protein
MAELLLHDIIALDQARGNLTVRGWCSPAHTGPTGPNRGLTQSWPSRQVGDLILRSLRLCVSMLCPDFT